MRASQRGDRGGGGGGGGGATGLRPLPNINLKKNVDNVDTMVSDVVRDLSFSRNQPLQSFEFWKIKSKSWEVLDEF